MQCLQFIIMISLILGETAFARDDRIQVKQTLDRLNKINLKNPAQCSTTPSPSPSPTPSPSPSLYPLEKLPGSKVEASVLSLEEAQKLFEEMKGHKEIPFEYPVDGCYARAHKMVQLMESKGVIAGKVFVTGDLQVNTENVSEGYVRWWYHVAPVILVKDQDGNAKPYVIDPSVFNEIVPQEKWTGVQTSENQKECTREVFYSNRFVVAPYEKDAKRDMYRPSDLLETQEVLRMYSNVVNDKKNLDELTRINQEAQRDKLLKDEEEKNKLMEIKKKLGSGATIRVNSEGQLYEKK